MAQATPVITATGAPVSEREPEAVRGRSLWQVFWLRFRKDRVGLAGLVLCVEFGLVALLAPVISALTGHSPNELFQGMLTTSLGLPRGPTGSFWFGADQVGRDVFVRTVYGARTSLVVAIVGTGAATGIGVVLGLVSGYFGRWVDLAISRLIDIFLSLPLLLFAIGISTVCSATAAGCFGGLLQPGLSLVTGIIALFSWPYVARIVRGEVLSLKEREFALAARAMGASDLRIMFSDLLPNLVAPVLVYSTLVIPNNILFEASLSYLGVGVPQSIPSWGRMLSDATNGSLFTYAWWMMAYPGLFLVLATLAFNLLGDGLRDALDPRSTR